MLKIEDKDHAKIIYAQGEFNVDMGLKVKEIVSNCLDEVDLIVISLRNVIYIGSSGIRELINILKMINNKGKRLYLCDMSKEIRELFSFTYLDNIFKIYDNVNEALKM